MHRVDVCQAMADGVDDCAEHRVGNVRESVVDPKPVGTRRHQAGSTEVREMPGRLRLRDLEALVDVADADLSGEQKVEDAQASGLCERLDKIFEFVERLPHISIDNYIMTPIDVLY